MPESDSGRERFAIDRSSLSRSVLFAVLALLLGFSGGIAGGLVADRLDDAEPPVAPPAALPAATATPDTAQRINAAIERALPAVVTVIVDLPPQRLDDGRIVSGQNIGSGLIVSDAGHVITNFHVVDGGEAFTVVLATGERRPALAIADDSPFADLAVLQVPPQGLRSLAFGDSDALRRGDRVVAVSGGPLFFDNSVTVGVVSAVGRSWPRNGVILEDLVQTDAAVNHGDSGGALVNLDGELVGLLTTVVRRDATGRAVEGISFAQSSNSLRAAVESIVATGGYPRARPGIERPGRHHLEISPQLAEERGLPVPAGALVIAPEPGSPAEAAGVEGGDIVVALNGVAVDFDHPLPNLLKLLPRGADADLFIVRDGRQLLITVSPWQE